MPIAKALKRREERPDIHKSVDRSAHSFDASVREMVLDLKNHVPELSNRQISTLVGVSKDYVRKVLDNSIPAENWTEEDNPASSAAELAALRKHHPGGYRDDPAANDEPPGIAHFEAPPFYDRYRRADQSHTLKRPITLATTPFDVAA